MKAHSGTPRLSTWLHSLGPIIMGDDFIVTLRLLEVNYKMITCDNKIIAT